MGAGASGAANAPPPKIDVERVFDSENSVPNNSDLVFQKRNTLNKRRDGNDDADINILTKSGNNSNKITNTNSKSGDDFVFPDDELRNSPQIMTSSSVTHQNRGVDNSTRVDDIEDDDNTSVLSYGDNEKEVVEDLENLESSMNSVGSIVPPLSQNIMPSDKMNKKQLASNINNNTDISKGENNNMTVLPRSTPPKASTSSPAGSWSLQKSPAESVSSLDSLVEIVEERSKGATQQVSKTGSNIKNKLPASFSPVSTTKKQTSQESNEASRERPLAVPLIDTKTVNIPAYQKALSPISETYLSSPRTNTQKDNNQRNSSNNHHNQSKAPVVVSPRIGITSSKQMPYNMADESPSSKAVRAIVESSANFLVDLEDSVGSIDSLEASSTTIDADSSLRNLPNNIADNTSSSIKQRRGSKSDASGKKDGDAKKEEKAQKKKTTKRESLHRYLDITTQAGNDRSEAIMGLQRQKIWSYAQNAQLQREVDMLQKQLEALESLEKQMESSKAKSASNQTTKAPRAARGAISNNSSNDSLTALEKESAARVTHNSNDLVRGDKESNGMPFKFALSSLHRQQQNSNRSYHGNDIDGNDDATSPGIDNPLTSLPSTIIGKGGRGRRGLSKAKSTSNREQRIRRHNVSTDEEDYNFSDVDSGTENGSACFSKKLGKDGSGSGVVSSNFYDFDSKAQDHHHLDVILEKKSTNATRDSSIPKASVPRGRAPRASRDKAVMEKGDALDRALSLAADSKLPVSNTNGGATHDTRLRGKDYSQRKQQYPNESEHHHYNLSSDFEDDGYASVASNSSITFNGQSENKNGKGIQKARKPNRFKKPAGNDDSGGLVGGGSNIAHIGPSLQNNITVDNDNDSVGGLSATEAQHAKKAKSRSMLQNLNRRRRRSMDGTVSEQDSVTEDEDNVSLSAINDMSTMFNPSEHKRSFLSGERKPRRRPQRTRRRTDNSEAKGNSSSTIEEKDYSSQNNTDVGERKKSKLWTRALDIRWGEVSLLLRKKIDCDEDIQYTVAAAEAGLMFTDQLNNVAKTLDVLRGTLSRWLLPYDNNTRIDEQCSTPHSVLENMPDSIRGKISERQIHYLVAGANSVRKLVRIKIADDNDLEQARQALKTALDFFRRLQEDSNDAGITPHQLLMMRDD